MNEQQINDLIEAICNDTECGDIEEGTFGHEEGAYYSGVGAAIEAMRKFFEK